MQFFSKFFYYKAPITYVFRIIITIIIFYILYIITSPNKKFKKLFRCMDSFYYMPQVSPESHHFSPLQGELLSKFLSSSSYAPFNSIRSMSICRYMLRDKRREMTMTELETRFPMRRTWTASVALSRRDSPRKDEFDRPRGDVAVLWQNDSARACFLLTTVILIELVQWLKPRDRRLVYRKFPRHVLAGLPRGILLPWAACLLSPAPAFLSALWSALLPRRGFRSVAAAMTRVSPRVSATRTLSATPISCDRDYTAPWILALRFGAFVERAVSVERHAFVNAW